MPLPAGCPSPIPPTPSQTVTVTSAATLTTAINNAIPDSRIVITGGGAGSPVTLVVDVEPTTPGLQIMANGYVIIDGFVDFMADRQWLIGLEVTNPVAVVNRQGMQVDGGDCRIINCHFHTFEDHGSTGSPNCVLLPGGQGGLFCYGCVFYDSRHVVYIQNTMTENKVWFVHCYLGDVNVHPGTGTYSQSRNIQEYSSDITKTRNEAYHENIIAKGTAYVGSDASSGVAHTNEFVGNYWYRALMNQYSRPNEIIFKNNYMVEPVFEQWGAIGSRTCAVMGTWHGAGEAQFGYTHNSEFTGNTIYRGTDTGNSHVNLTTCIYDIPAIGRTYGAAAIRAGDIWDNNTYYGDFRATFHASGNLQAAVTNIANWRTYTAAAGNQFDTNSTVISGPPPNHYQIFQNEADPDRALLVVFRFTGANVPVTLPRAGDIYDLKDQWAVTPLYSGAGPHNVTQNPGFLLIKYTGGVLPQTLVPIAGWNNPGLYTDQAGGTTNLHLVIDETGAPNNTDYIKSPINPNNAAIAFPMTAGTDPVSSVNHVMSFTISKDAAGGATINATTEWRQSYVNEGSPGTLIATRSYPNISDTWTTTSDTLTGGEADSITNYAVLWSRLVMDQA